MMRLQLSIEVLLGMALTLLVVLVLLGLFPGLHSNMISAESALARIANASSSYPARLLPG